MSVTLPGIPNITADGVLGVVRGYLSYLILLGGIVMLLIVVTFSFWAFLAPAVGILLGGVGGIFIHSYRLESNQEPLDSRVGAIGTSVYIIGLFTIYRPVIGVRPSLHYALHGMMAAFIAYQIFRGGSRGTVTAQIAAFAFFTFWSSQLAFPAGMYSPDTFAFIPATESIVTSSGLEQVETYRRTPGHMIFVAEFAQITGLSVDISYRFAATLVIAGTVLVLAYADRAIPGLSRRTGLLATLIFVFMSYSIAKGTRPTKLNFFYPVIPIIALSVFKIKCGLGDSRQYLPLLLLVMVYSIFGHTYSSGAALILTGVLWLYLSGVPVLNGLDYSDRIPVRTTIAFGILCVMYLTYNGLVTGQMTARIGDTALSVVELFSEESAGGGGSGGGRYSQLSLSLLFISTGGQLIIFTLAMVGFAAMVRRREWGLDAVVFWIVIGFGIIGFSIFGNATDIPPQRIYSLLALFGLNFACAIGIIVIRSSTTSNIVGSSVVIILAILALSSPVAGVALSPYSDEIPVNRRYEMASNNAVDMWAGSYTSGEGFTTTGKRTDIPVKPLDDGEVSTLIDRSSISDRSVYIHSDLAETTGLLIDSRGNVLGSRIYAFVYPPGKKELDNTVYSNGKGDVFVKNNLDESYPSK
jgi:hypothetical protein